MKKALQTIQAIAVLAAAVLALIFVPHETLIPVAWAVLAVGAAGAFAVRAYIGKLDPVEQGQRRFLMVDLGMVFATAAFTAFVVLLIAYD